MARQAKTGLDPADFIEPLYVNGMNGRMLYTPAPKGKKREILVLYGHHAMLERWWGLIQNFSDLGAVTMPDLPGFGGMDSFYKIGKEASLDNYADYMAAFIKMRYKRKKVTIVGISWGFLIATRMLQRYPELTERVELLVSAAGFMRYDDFLFSKRRHRAYKYASRISAIPPTPFIFRYLALNGWVLRKVYARTNNAKHKFAQAGGQEEFDRMMDMEIKLWQINDVRTYMRTSYELLTVDNCRVPVNLPVWHVYTKNDHFFDNTFVEQHMRVVFAEFYPALINLKAHTVSVLADKKEAANLIPPVLRAAIRKLGKA
jgi:pimeloyl-ACP methyl ester carboxylesterase